MKISVIIPSLNVNDYIEECINSVINQTLKSLEIICVDAGSTDGTWEKLEYFSQHESRMHLVRSNVKSYGYQVNKGISLASGEYIAILESDDYVDLDFYEQLYLEASKEDCDFVKCGYYSYYTLKNGERFFLPKKLFGNSEMFSKLIDVKNTPAISIDDWYLWNGIYKKSFIEAAGISLTESKGAAFQDIGFLLQVNIKANVARYLEQPMYRYCRDREGSSSNLGKGLAYSYNEFKTQIERLKSKNELDSCAAKRALYLRMAKSFVCCHGECNMETNDIEQLLKYYRWFRDNLKKGIEDRHVRKEWLPKSMWNTLITLLKSEEQYLNKMLKQDEELKEALGDAEKIKLAVFGCGAYGFRAYRWLQQRKYSIKYFFDNNEDLWGHYIDDIPIMSPNSLSKIDKETVFLIANEAHVSDIYNQLIALGISDRKIITFR